MATQRRAKAAGQQNKIILLVVVAIASFVALTIILGLHNGPPPPIGKKPLGPAPSHKWCENGDCGDKPNPPPQPQPQPQSKPQQIPNPPHTTNEPSRDTSKIVENEVVSVGGSLPQSYSVCKPDDPLWAPTEEIGLRCVRQEHHYAFGRAWALGRDIFNFQTRRGLKPTDVFLDFGCGALRNGIWLIDYLEEGHYYGVEYNTLMFNAGKNYELALHGLQHKRPTLYNNAEDGQPGLKQWGVKFDRIMAFAVLIHLPVPLKHTVLKAFSEHLKVGGKLYLSHHLTPLTKEEMLNKYHFKHMHTESQKSEFSDTHLDWFEFERVEE